MMAGAIYDHSNVSSCISGMTILFISARTCDAKVAGSKPSGVLSLDAQKLRSFNVKSRLLEKIERCDDSSQLSNLSANSCALQYEAELDFVSWMIQSSSSWNPWILTDRTPISRCLRSASTFCSLASALLCCCSIFSSSNLRSRCFFQFQNKVAMPATMPALNVVLITEAAISTPCHQSFVHHTTSTLIHGERNTYVRFFWLIGNLSGRMITLGVNTHTMNVEDYRKISGPLEDFATVHPTIPGVSELFEIFKSFNEAKWAFRGQGTDRVLAASIERIAIRPGVAEDYVMREFRRRAHQYIANVPRDDEDLEWLALMQHHGTPTRLLDWTRSPHIAAFFAAQSSNSANPIVRKPKPEKPVEAFVIWAVDVDSINAEVVAILDIPKDNNDLSSRENFRRMYWDATPEDLLLVAAVQPHRMNERLTIQQGLFLFANHPLMSFRRCLAATLLLHANKESKPSGQWLHKLVVLPETRLDVLRALDKININSATLFPGLDGFCQSLHGSVQFQEQEDWPGISLTTDRERWVKGI
jgi:FRG domain